MACRTCWSAMMTRGCWNIPLFIFWGCLPLEVVFQWRLPSFDTFVHSSLIPTTKLSNLRKIIPVVADIFHFSYFEVVFCWRSSSFDTFVHSDLIPIASVSNLSKIWPVFAELFDSIFWGHLPLEVVLHWRSSSFNTFVHSGFIPIA